MTTKKINSIKKVRNLIYSEQNITKLMYYYNVVEKLFYHYKKVLNKSKQLEASQLLQKIRIIIIERMMTAKLKTIS